MILILITTVYVFQKIYLYPSILGVSKTRARDNKIGIWWGQVSPRVRIYCSSLTIFSDLTCSNFLVDRERVRQQPYRQTGGGSNPLQASGKASPSHLPCHLRGQVWLTLVTLEVELGNLFWTSNKYKKKIYIYIYIYSENNLKS